MTEQKTERAALVDRLRVVADLLDDHPELPLPSVGVYGVYWHLYSWEHSDLRSTAATIRRVIGGKWDKTVDNYTNKMQFRSGDYQIEVDRDVVCTRRVVGVEKVTLPAVLAQPEREVEREIVEWDCEPGMESE